MEELFQLLLVLAILGFPLIKGLITVIKNAASPKNGMEQVKIHEDTEDTMEDMFEQPLLLQRNEAPVTKTVRTAQTSRKNRSGKSTDSSGFPVLQQSVAAVQSNLSDLANPESDTTQTVTQAEQSLPQNTHPVIALFHNPATIQQIVLAAEILKRPDFGDWGKNEHSLQHQAPEVSLPRS